MTSSSDSHKSALQLRRRPETRVCRKGLEGGWQDFSGTPEGRISSRQGLQLSDYFLNGAFRKLSSLRYQKQPRVRDFALTFFEARSFLM